MPTTIFRSTSPTNQDRPKVKISNYCVFWIKFGIWANNGPRITWYKFEMATATFYASTHQQKPRTFRRGPLFFSDFCCYADNTVNLFVSLSFLSLFRCKFATSCSFAFAKHLIYFHGGDEGKTVPKEKKLSGNDDYLYNLCPLVPPCRPD